MRKVAPGQKWKPRPAAEENAISATVDFVRSINQNIDGGVGQRVDVDAAVITVRNDSGADVRQYEGLSLPRTGLLSGRSRERVWLAATSLSLGSRNDVVVVALEPIQDGKIKPAQIAGDGLAYVNVIATWHRRAYPAAGADVLKSGLFGPIEILETPAATGEQLLYVRIGHADNRMVFGSVGSSGLTEGVWSTGTLTAGSGLVAIVDPDAAAGTYTASANQVTAYNYGGELVEDDLVSLVPGDDWLPLATKLLC